jgi:hypothetical protein
MASMHRALRTLASDGVHGLGSSMAPDHGGFSARSPAKNDGADEKIRKALCPASTGYGAHVYETFGGSLKPGAASQATPGIAGMHITEWSNRITAFSGLNVNELHLRTHDISPRSHLPCPARSRGRNHGPMNREYEMASTRNAARLNIRITLSGNDQRKRSSRYFALKSPV